MARLNDYLVLDTSQSSQLSLNNYAMCMCVLNNLLGQSNIVLEALRRSVDHDRCESAIDAALAELKAVAVIQMQSDRDLRILSYSSLNQLYQIGMVGISSCSLGNLQNNRRLQLAGCFCNTLNDFHVVYVESTDRITAIVGFLKHFSGCY